jgi:hypothetical protein
MNVMSTPHFLITPYLESTSNLEELRKVLFEKNVLSKDYNDEGLVLLYTKFGLTGDELVRECRSLVIDRETFKIKSYSCETPLLNKEGMNYMLAHMSDPTVVTPCYEGTYLSVFNHNSKWYVSTRRCLNSNDSVFNQTETEDSVSHFEMFEDVLKNSNFQGFADFSSKLNPEYSYYFVLIHHKNKHLIDYTNMFGTNYTRLCLTTVRDVNMCELDMTEGYEFLGTHIFTPKDLDSIEEFANSNKQVKYDEYPTTEGVMVRMYDTTLNKCRLIKLQNMSYQFSLVLGAERNIFKGLLYLYQNDKLADYFSQNTKLQNIRKIVNPLNTCESYDTIGMVDAVFKVCTSELFELFKVLWSLKTCEHLNKPLYDMLPKEYKDILFVIRGLYYKKKASLHGKENVSTNDIKSAHLKINDIYNHLKTLSTDTFVAFLRMRKLMFNWVRVDPKLNDFSPINKLCDKVHVKLCAIFTNKLFPNIMPNDIPPQKEAQNAVQNAVQNATVELTV